MTTGSHGLGEECTSEGGLGTRHFEEGVFGFCKKRLRIRRLVFRLYVAPPTQERVGVKKGKTVWLFWNVVGEFLDVGSGSGYQTMIYCLFAGK